MSKELFVRAEEVAGVLGISKPYAYKLVREMNEELKQKGFLTIPGRVSRRYFEESSMDCGKISKEGTKCQHTKTRPKAHGMRPFTLRTGQGKRKRR